MCPAWQVWDETQMRSLAQRFGYELPKTIVFDQKTDHPVNRLVNVARQLDVDAVIVPNLVHLGGDVPGDLVRVCDVITVNPQDTYARWALPTCTDGRTKSAAKHGAWIASRPE